VAGLRHRELVDGEVSVAAPITDRSERTVGSIAISGRWNGVRIGAPRSDLVAYVRESARRSLATWGRSRGSRAARAVAPPELDSAPTAPETGRHGGAGGSV